MRTSLLLTALAAGCSPPTPRAGIITEDDRSLIPGGETSAGTVGDYYLTNDLATFIIQRPGQQLALGPYGGTLIDAALHGTDDHFGELIPTLAIGRTLFVDSIRVVDDGSDGGDATLIASATDATNVYYNIEGIAPSILSYEPDGSGLLGRDPDQPMGLSVQVHYTLPEDEARLTIRYTFTNETPDRLEVPLGLIIDSRGAVEGFNLGPGYFSNLSKSFDVRGLFAQLDAVHPSPVATLIHEESTIGVLPRRIGDKEPPTAFSLMVPSLGAIFVLEVRSPVGALKEPSFVLRGGESTEVVVDVLVGATPQDVIERAWDLIGTETSEVAGCVEETDGSPAVGVRVGLTHIEWGVQGTYRTDARGCFSGRVPPGRYTAVAGAAYRPPSDEVVLDVPGSVELTLAPLGRIQMDVSVFNDLDTPVASPHPCRVILIGERPMVEHPALTDRPLDDPGRQVARMWHLRHCNETLEVAPGPYLAMVTRGPEFSVLEQVIDVAAGALTRVSGSLHREVDSTDLAASDFHVHSVFSTDTAVSAHDRVMSLASEGMDFWASTDHDYVADFFPYVAQAGLLGELLTIPGSEVTTFDTGHFGAYPLDFDPDSSNGGTLEWAATRKRSRLTMPQLFAAIRARGGLVQVNHPRSGGQDMGAYFSRAGLTFDADTRRPVVDGSAQSVPSTTLRFDASAPYFSHDFDIIEVVNGASTYVANGMVYETDAERQGHDWMNYLTAGYRKVAVANSDTHSIANHPGDPRTYVAGHESGIDSLVAQLERGNAFLSTGPILRVSLVDGEGTTAGMGDVLSPTSSTVTLRVTAETPSWYEVDALEVIANAFFPDPTTGEPPPRAAPLAALTPVDVPRANGGTGRVAEAQLTLDLDASPFDGKDSWIVVRVGGTGSIVYPAMIGGGGQVDTTATTAEAFHSARWGPHPWAMSNAVFIDRDGDGRYR